MRRLVSVAIVSLIMVAALTGPASAEEAPVGGDAPPPRPAARFGGPTTGDGAPTLEAGLRSSSPGESGGPTRRKGRTSGGARFYWQSLPSNSVICGNDGNWYPRAPFGEGTEAEATLPVGVAPDLAREGFDVTLWDRQTQLPVPGSESRVVCSGTGGAVALPPEPPSAEEVWDRVPIPEGRMGINPAGDGLTGLDTWLWYEGDAGPVQLPPIEIRGYSVTAIAKPAVFTWKMADDPASQYSSPVPGSQAHPAAVHVYQTKRDYNTVMEVAWEGSYSFSGFGIALAGQPLGRVELTSERSYHVVEARGVRR